MRIFDKGEYKDKIVTEIINNERIVKAIDSESKEYNPEMPDSLLGVNVFPHIFIPNIQNSTETYIMLACEVTGVNNYNPLYHNIKLTVRVMTHKDKLFMKGEKNTRVDYISREIIGMLENSLKYGFGELRLVTDREITLNERYIYRELSYKTVDIVSKCC